jgi:hypothetical protein
MGLCSVGMSGGQCQWVPSDRTLTAVGLPLSDCTDAVQRGVLGAPSSGGGSGTDLGPIEQGIQAVQESVDAVRSAVDGVRSGIDGILSALGAMTAAPSAPSGPSGDPGSLTAKFAPWTDLLGRLAGAFNRTGSGGCSGPSWDLRSAGLPVTLAPFSTCSDPGAWLAPTVKRALTAALVVGTVLACLRILGSSVGVHFGGGDT